MPFFFFFVFFFFNDTATTEIYTLSLHDALPISQKRVLYVSARLFQTQYTDAVLHNASNDFINFYQSIDMLIVDDIQEWEIGRAHV